jgi:hypothetical protein
MRSYCIMLRRRQRLLQRVCAAQLVHAVPVRISSSVTPRDSSTVNVSTSTTMCAIH